MTQNTLLRCSCRRVWKKSAYFVRKRLRGFPLSLFFLHLVAVATHSQGDSRSVLEEFLGESCFSILIDYCHINMIGSVARRAAGAVARPAMRSATYRSEQALICYWKYLVESIISAPYDEPQVDIHHRSAQGI